MSEWVYNIKMQKNDVICIDFEYLLLETQIFTKEI